MNKLIIDKLINYIRPNSYLVLEQGLFLRDQNSLAKIGQIEADNEIEAAYRVWTEHNFEKCKIETLLSIVIGKEQSRFDQIKNLISWNKSWNDYQNDDYFFDLYNNNVEIKQPDLAKLVDFCLNKEWISKNKLHNILIRINPKNEESCFHFFHFE